MNSTAALPDELPWDKSALEEVEQAPRHLHAMIRAFCEDYARTAGKTRVDMDVINALRGEHGDHGGHGGHGHAEKAAAAKAKMAGNGATGGHPAAGVQSPANGQTASGNAHESSRTTSASAANAAHPAGPSAAESATAATAGATSTATTSAATANGSSPAASGIKTLEDLDTQLDPFLDLYAEETDSPLTSAFLRRSPPHVALPSTRVQPADLQQTWLDALKNTLPQQRRRCLYVHVPFCRCRCSYCPFYLMSYNENDAASYVDLLLRDIELTASQIPPSDADSGGEYQAIFFGGGTPSDLSAEQLSKLLRAFAKHFPLSRDCEITVEGRVRGFDADKARACFDAGATRISLGVQSFDTTVRQAVGRLADEAEVCRTLEALGSIDGLALNIDLIFGLPGQTREVWARDLERVNSIGGILGVDLYELKKIPGSPLTRAQSMGRVEEGLDLAQRAYMYEEGANTLEAAGWERLSCCHWGRGGNRQNRYNVYAKSGAACLPFGCCSGGRISRMSMGGPQDVSDYRAALDRGEKPLSSARIIDPIGLVHDRIAGQLEFGRLDPESVQDGLGARLRPLLSQWERAGLLESSDSGWGLTLAGRFWIKEISTRLARALR